MLTKLAGMALLAIVLNPGARTITAQPTSALARPALKRGTTSGPSPITGSATTQPTSVSKPEPQRVWHPRGYQAIAPFQIAPVTQPWANGVATHKPAFAHYWKPKARPEIDLTCNYYNGWSMLRVSLA